LELTALLDFRPQETLSSQLSDSICGKFPPSVWGTSPRLKMSFPLLKMKSLYYKVFQNKTPLTIKLLMKI
jgi:hypothetical protein